MSDDLSAAAAAVLQAFGQSTQRQSGPGRQTPIPREMAIGVVINEMNRSAQDALEKAGPGWRPKLDVGVRPAEQQRPIQLRHFGFKRILVTSHLPRLLAGCRKVCKRFADLNVLRAAKDVTYSMVRLWAGHFDHCPYDSARHAALCEAAVAGGFATAWPSRQQWAVAVSVAAFFERSLVCLILTRQEGACFTRGLAYEYALGDPRVDLLGYLFFRAQALITPTAWSALGRICPIDAHPLVDSLLPQVMWLVFGVRVRPSRRGPRVAQSVGVRRHRWPWTKRVRLLARLLIPYMVREVQDPIFSPRPNGADAPEDNGRGSGTLMLPGNPFAEDEDPYHTHRPDANNGLPPGLSNPPPRRVDTERLDQYYRQHAAALSVQAEASEKARPTRPDLLPVGFMDAEEAGLTALLSGQIDWFRTRVGTENGRKALRLFRRTEPLEIPLAGRKPTGTGPPNLLLIVDSSGSMEFHPNATRTSSRGKYDIVLKACYGIFQHIESTGHADRVKVACINFSRGAIESGWWPFRNLGRVKEVLLRYQGGGTYLNTDAVQRAFQGRPGKFLAILITDGAIGNAPQAAEALREVRHGGCDLALLHIGRPNDFTEAIRAMDCPVKIVSRAEDLIGATLGIAREKYSRTA
jgi:hypothetical protein